MKLEVEEGVKLPPPDLGNLQPSQKDPEPTMDSQTSLEISERWRWWYEAPTSRSGKLPAFPKDPEPTMGGGVKLPLPDQGNLQPPQKIRNPNFFGGFSRAHLLSNHSSRLICNADNSWNILTKSSQSLHWKYQISNKNCENGKIIMK